MAQSFFKVLMQVKCTKYCLSWLKVTIEVIAFALLGTLSSRSTDSDGDAETCEKAGERTPLWQEFTNIKQRGFRTVKFIDIIDIRRLFIRMN